MKDALPALARMIDDDDITLSAMRVYMRVVRLNPLIFGTPSRVKELEYATGMGLHRNTVRDSLRLLIERGYLVETGRGRNNVRIIQATCTIKPPTSQAA